MTPRVETAGGTCAIGTLESLVAALRDWGADVAGILARADLRSEQLEQPELRISQEQFRRAWEAAREVTGDDAIGIHVIDRFDALQLTTLYMYLASSSATGREAFERAQPYLRLAHDTLEISLSEEGGMTICRTRFRGWDNDRMLAEYSVGLIVKVAPAVVGANAPNVAWFEHPAPDYAAEYEEILGVEVRFEAPCNAVVGLAKNLDRPLPNADAVLCTLLERQAIDALAKLPAASGFVSRVQQCIEAALPVGDTSADAIAGSLGLSSRTLRRRLSDCDISYQQLLDGVRCDLARRALGRPGVSVGEVAYSLGFSDTSAFHKAFRRWTGKRPSDVARGRD